MGPSFYAIFVNKYVHILPISHDFLPKILKVFENWLEITIDKRKTQAKKNSGSRRHFPLFSAQVMFKKSLNYPVFFSSSSFHSVHSDFSHKKKRFSEKNMVYVVHGGFLHVFKKTQANF